MLLGVSYALFFLPTEDAGSRPAIASTPSSVPKADLTVISAQFKDLYGQLNAAIRERDRDLLRPVVTREGPTERRALMAIRALEKDAVLDLTKVAVHSVVIRDLQDRTAVLEVQSQLHPCFQTESGTDITRGPETVERITKWTLRRDSGGDWLLHESILENQEIVRGADVDC